MFKIFKKFKVILLSILLSTLLITASASFAKTQELADVSIYNFEIKTQNEEEIEFSFDLKNNSNIQENNLKYGYHLENSEDVIIKKYLFEENISIGGEELIEKTFIYKIDNSKETKNINLFVTNESGIPVALSIIEGLNIGYIENAEKDIISDCKIEKINEENILSCETTIEKMDEGLNNTIEIYNKNIFGDLMLEKILIPEMIFKNKATYVLPKVGPGFYELKSNISGLEFLNKFSESGEFVNFFKPLLDKASYLEDEVAKVELFVSSNVNGLGFEVGIKDDEGKNCGVSSTRGQEDMVEVYIKRDCADAELFVIAKNREGEVVNKFGEKGKDVFDIFQKIKLLFKEFSSNVTIMYILGGGLFGASLISFFRKKKTLGISLIILLIFLTFLYGGLSRVLASSYQDNNNSYIVNFNKDSYKEGETINFALGVTNKTSFTKLNDTSIEMSINGGAFYEIVSIDSTKETHSVIVGNHLTGGNNYITLKTEVSSKFDIASFDLYTFGNRINEIEFDIQMVDEKGDLIGGGGGNGGNGEIINENCISEDCEEEIVNCTDSAWTLPTSTYCAGDAFIQVSDCNNTRKAVGSDNDENCVHASTYNLNCSIDKVRWEDCGNGEVIRLLTSDDVYIKVSDSKGTTIENISWVINGKGGMEMNQKVNEKLQDVGVNRIGFSVNKGSEGKYATGKFFDFEVNPIGINMETKIINLMILDPQGEEI